MSNGRVAPSVRLETDHVSRKTLFSLFQANDSGNVGIVFALTSMIIISVVGGAVDYGRWLSARSQTQDAIDSALLAAGRTAQTTYGDSSASVASANAYYAQMKSPIVVSDTIVFAATDGTATSFTAKGTAYVTTPFLSIVGITELPVLATTGVTQAQSTIAQGGNSGSSVEIGLMLDTTGSMSGQKLTDLKAAATDLVDIVIWQDQSAYTSRIAIAPFANTVNVGDYFTTLTGQNPAASTTYTYPATCLNSNGTVKSTCLNQAKYLTNQAKAKCVVERSGTYEFTETMPAAGSYLPSYYSALVTYYQSQGYDSYTSAMYSSLSYQTCPETSQIVPLTSDKTALKSTISGLVANNSTAGALGTAWAWYLISPDWGTIFTGTAKPDSYSKLTELGAGGQPKLQKIAILMTDGAYNTWQYPINNGLSVSSISSKAKSICTAMKAKGIKVYTIGFDLQGDSNAIDALSKCATDSTYFYNAATGDQLKQAFRDIALKISALRLSH